MSCYEIKDLAEFITSFRQELSTFADTTVWTDEIIEDAFYAALGETNSSRWGELLNCKGNFRRKGVFLFAAHYLISFYNQVLAGEPASLNYAPIGKAIQKKIGDESVTYRIASVKKVEDDWLTTTQFGTLFLRMRRRAGMGAIAV